MWSFAIEEMVQEINRFAQRTLVPAYYEYTPGLLLVKSEVWHLEQSIIWRNERKDFLDYIMPETAQRSGVALQIPLTYTCLFYSYIYLWNQQKDADTRQAMREFPLKINISYRDIAGQRHQVAFNLRVHLSYMRTPKDSTLSFEEYIEAQKVDPHTRTGRPE